MWSRAHQNNFTKFIFIKTLNCPYPPLTKSKIKQTFNRVTKWPPKLKPSINNPQNRCWPTEKTPITPALTSPFNPQWWLEPTLVQLKLWSKLCSSVIGLLFVIIEFVFFDSGWIFWKFGFKAQDDLKIPDLIDCSFVVNVFIPLELSILSILTLTHVDSINRKRSKDILESSSL